MFITRKRTAAVKGKGTRIPRADTRYANTAAVGFMGNIILNGVTFPQTKFLCFITLMFSALEIKMFENDDTSGMEHSKISDCRSNLDRKLVIQPASIKPQCMCAGITMFSLPTLNSVQYHDCRWNCPSAKVYRLSE